MATNTSDSKNQSQPGGKKKAAKAAAAPEGQQPPEGGGDQGGGKQPAQSGDKVAALRITAKTDRRFRAGMRFTRTERVIRADSVDETQLAQLRRDPVLVVIDDEVTADELSR